MKRHKKVNGKVIIGLVEEITVFSKEGQRKLEAKIDTGASKSSLDIRLASQLNLGPIIKSKVVKSAHGNRLRPVIEVEIRLAGKRMKEEFTLADRSHMKYKALIGQNILKNGYLIDPSK